MNNKTFLLVYSIWLVSGCKQNALDSVENLDSQLNAPPKDEVVLKAAFVSKIENETQSVISNRLSYISARIRELEQRVELEQRPSFEQAYQEELEPLRSERTNAFFGLSGYEAISILEAWGPGGETSGFVAICKPSDGHVQLILILSAPLNDWIGVRSRVEEVCTNSFPVPLNPPRAEFLFGSLFDDQGNATNTALLRHLPAPGFVEQR